MTPDKSNPDGFASAKSRPVEVYVEGTSLAFKTCARILPTPRTNREVILTGLLVKGAKLFGALERNTMDGQAFRILMRSLYECCLSITFILKKEKAGLEGEFFLSEAMHAQGRINMLRKAKLENSPAGARSIEHAQRTIRALHYESSDLPKKAPKNWSQNYTYADMAEQCGEDSLMIYIDFYSTSSGFAHPSWSDIRRRHVVERSGRNSLNMMYEQVSTGDWLVACCTVLRALEVYAKALAGESGDKPDEAIRTLHAMLHSDYRIEFPDA